ncbi:WXG100 family type VII secretion target [Sanguibacter suaedae]|uniref:ESAT-6-like protein n=1 Tax=Sanguibacter suaedae TaxID=2795737 RepID=A0A934M978_9MICO|nr:WXG100 family type VII secretion target [Sanguibacter suaedae]MBI9114358.1 WXG100 family type VII secretion target [Sanguibacter suaedae]
MSDLKVNFGALSNAAADIQGSAGTLQRILDDMDSALQPLRANWDGEASSAYTTAKTQWTTAITDMKALLEDVGRAVRSSNEDYQSAERSNAQRW